MEVSLRYDLRTPEFGTAPAVVYSAFLEQCAWADAQGFARIRLHEHHGTGDGYLPSPFVAGAAVAARTSHVRIRIAVVLLALHDPLRIAEDAAVLDVLSGGRLELVAGLGYVPSEYEMFGREFATRARTMEESVGVLRHAWTGETFEHRGVLVRVTPRPLQRPGPPVLIGGAVEASAFRAARIGDGFEPSASGAHEDVYRAECVRLGKDPGPPLPPRLKASFLHVADDPEAAWHAIAPYALHEMNAYGRMQERTAEPMFRPVDDDLAAVRASGMFQVVTPDECIAMLRPLGPSAEIRLHPLMSGLDPNLSWSSLELLANRVLPALG